MIYSRYPLFWVDEHFTVDKKTADLFKNQIQIPLRAVNVLKWLIFGIGCILFIANLFYAYRLKALNSVFKKSEPVSVLKIDFNEPDFDAMNGNKITQVDYKNDSDRSDSGAFE